jgi:hypothetical protein
MNHLILKINFQELKLLAISAREERRTDAVVGPKGKAFRCEMRQLDYDKDLKLTNLTYSAALGTTAFFSSSTE